MKTLFDKVHAARLTKLANFLVSDECRDETFYFGSFCTTGKSIGRTCDTVACAIGWCPTVFPKDWKYRTDKFGNTTPNIKGIAADREVLASICAFFGLEDREGHHLFYLTAQKPKLYGGKHLSSDSTRREVAANIIAFLEYKGEQI